MLRNLRVLVVAAVTASTLTTLSTGTAQAATSNQASAPVHRASISCSRPKGAKANYSWGDGRTSVTVYFNNHCSHKVGAKLHIKNSIGPNYTLCLTTNGGTKGKKKYSIGAARTLTAITSGC